MVTRSVRDALDHGQVIDITTVGRRTGRARRIEIVVHNFGGRLYISGIPRAGKRRSWLANMDANPSFTIHLKGPVVADVPARARIIDDPAERRRVLTEVARAWRRQDVDAMVAHSPLVEVTIEGSTEG